MATVYGIDLGTTYSCIASCDNKKKLSVIHPQNAITGGASLPSVICYEKGTGKPIVGLSAKNSLGSPDLVNRIMTFTKRYMGNEFYPEQIQIKDDKVNISPIEGSACILHHLLTCANEELKGNGETATTKAVITIPAGFTNKQRECTKLAAELAGIEVLGLVHEPTAAAISYGIKSGETILVFDLGGGTLDVSLVTNNKGTYKVIAAAGDFDVLGRHLGGKDWDEKLLELAVEKHGYKLGNLPNIPKEAELWRLKNIIEECKIQLSTMTEFPIMFPDFSSETITRKEFENYTDNLVKDCLKVVKATLDKADKESNKGAVKIDRCVLSGGSSNMPMIKNNLSRYLAERIANKRKEADWLHIANPERAIAEGAARYAYMLENNLAHNDSVLVSVEEKSSHSYGTSIFERRQGSIGEKLVKNLILSTDPMIIDSKPFKFKVTENGQSSISVDLYENNSINEKIPLDNNLQPIYNGSYKFNPKTPVTQQTIVNFMVSRNKDGIISIHVESDGHKPDDYTISTVTPPISEDTRQHVLQSIELMDISLDECK